MGFISPTDPVDQYPVIDPLYGIDGFRNVNTLSDLNNIPGPRRRAGMVVGVSGGTSYYKLNQSPWNYNITDWSVFTSGSDGYYLPLSGGTVTGQVIFSGSSPNPEYIAFFNGADTGAKLGIGVSGNLSDGITNDILNSGGPGYAKLTITSSEVVNNIVDGNGSVIMTNAFNITPTGDIIVGGFANFATPPNFENTNTHILTRNEITGNLEIRELQTFPDIYTDDFIFNQSTYDLTISLNDGSQYTQNLSIFASDVTITGGTYNPQSGVVTFTNNTGGTFSVSGFSTGYTDIYTTASTFNPITKVATFNRTDNNSYTLNLSALTTTDTFVTGGTYSNGSATFTNNTGGTFNVSGFYTGATDVFVTGGTYSNGTTTFTNNTGGTFNVTGYYTGETDDNQYVTGFTYNNNQFTISDNSGNTFNATINTVTGLTVNGSISATTYQNLPTDIRVTGGTYSNGTTIFTNNTGGTFNVTGFYTGGTDVFVTGGTYFGSTITFTNNTGGTFTVTGITSSTSFTGGTVTGPTIFTNGLTANTISATTYQNLPTDIRVTGGTYSNGTTIFTNNTGGTFNVTGFYTGSTDNDRYVTGFTYNDSNQFTISDNSGNTFNATINTVTGLTVNGSISATTYQNLPIDIRVTGGTYSAGTVTFTNNTGGTFNVTGLYTGVTSIGRVLFVSNTGNDNTAVVGDITKPWSNIYAAKSASTSGDTIYVLPGTWSFDNTNSAGNPYNSQMDLKVNLWKNGITYYFSPNTKIIFYNQTVTGSPMYLFNPLNTSGETCTVLGYLEWEGRSTGSDSFNGQSAFLWLESNNDSGFTFHAEVKKLTSYASEVIRVNRNVTFTADTQVADIRIVADEIYKQYLGGQSGAASTEFINSTDSVLIYNSHVKRRIKNDSSSGQNFFQVTGNYTRSMVNFYGDYFLNATTNAPSVTIRSFTGVVNIDINEMYWNGTFVQSLISGGGTLNIKGNLNDYVKNNSNTGGVVSMTIANNTINFNGNIFTNTGSGIGRYIAATSNASTINIKGDITFIGTGTTTQTMFQAQTNGYINYSGKITGTYGGPIARTYNGTVNLNNCFIRSTTDSASSQLFINGISTLGYFRLNNSYVELKNNTNALSDGKFLNSFINNSTIINTGSGNTLSNTGTTGNLQITNTTLISSFSGATSILNTGTTPVISTNTTVNTPFNIVDLRGSINIFTDLIY